MSSTQEKLLEARAELVYLENLPESSFRPMFFSNGGIRRHTTDIKADAIQKAIAEVKRLEVLVNGEKS